MYACVSRLVPAEQRLTVHANLGEVEWLGLQDHIRDTIDKDLAVVRANQTLPELTSHLRRASTDRIVGVFLDDPSAGRPPSRSQVPSEIVLIAYRDAQIRPVSDLANEKQRTAASVPCHSEIRIPPRRPALRTSPRNEPSVPSRTATT